MWLLLAVGKANLIYPLCYPTRSFTLLKSDATTTAHQYDEIFYVLVGKEGGTRERNSA